MDPELFIYNLNSVLHYFTGYVVFLHNISCFHQATTIVLVSSQSCHIELVY